MESSQAAGPGTQQPEEGIHHLLFTAAENELDQTLLHSIYQVSVLLRPLLLPLPALQLHPRLHLVLIGKQSFHRNPGFGGVYELQAEVDYVGIELLAVLEFFCVYLLHDGENLLAVFIGGLFHEGEKSSKWWIRYI